MISFYMHIFLKAVSIALLLASQIAFAEEEPTKEEAPLIPVSGLSADKSISAAEQSIAEDRFVLNGFSIAGYGGTQAYNLTLVPLYSGVQQATLTAKTADIQSVGVIGRYSIIPTGSLGSDFSLSVGTSLNHDSLGYSPIVMSRFEFNLGWGFLTEGKMRFYLLGGFGYEAIRGKEIENFLAAGGGTAQVGAGLVLSSAINIEGFVVGSRHSVSNDFEERIAAAAVKSGATGVTFDQNKSYVESIAISGRLIYKF